MQKQPDTTPVPPVSPQQCCGSGLGCLLAFLAGTAAGVAGYLLLRRRQAHRTVRLEDLRKAYAGLSPDEEEQ